MIETGTRKGRNREWRARSLFGSLEAVNDLVSSFLIRPARLRLTNSVASGAEFCECFRGTQSVSFGPHLNSVT